MTDPRTVTATILDLPPIDGDEPRHRPLLAVAAARFGGAHVWRSVGGDGYRLWCSVGAAATMGHVVTALDVSVTGDWQDQAFEVALDHGEIYAAPRAAVLAGINLAAIRSDGGAWELLRFAGAELIGPSRYRLSDLQRGCHGTAPIAAAAGADLVIIDDAVVRLPVHLREIGTAMELRICPTDRAYTDATAAAISYTPDGLAHRWPELLVQPVALTVGQNAPPAAVADGQVHIIGDAPIGAWTGRAGHVTGFLFGAWRFQAPFEGYSVWDLASHSRRTFSAGAWL